MKNLKKLISVVLTVAMLVSSIAVVTAKDFGDVDTSAAYSEAVSVLSDLAILEGDEAGNFNPDAEIKRSEFAAVVCRAMGQENAAKGAAGTTSFNDVAAEHWASGYINWAAQLGIVNGKGEGIFDPDAPVKYEEAIKMLVVALGYEPLAARKGGYPTGYLVVAASNGITKGVNLTGAANAPRSAVAVMVYNALDVALMDANMYSLSGDDEYVIYDDDSEYGRKTMLSEYLEITKVKANVSATALSDDKLATKAGKKVELNVTNTYGFSWDTVADALKTTYKYDKDEDYYYIPAIKPFEGESGASEFLGANVVAYIAEEDGDLVVKSVVLDTTSVETLEIVDGLNDAKVDYGKLTFEYYESEDDLRPEELDFENKITVYVNGVEVEGDAAEDWFNAIPSKASKVVFMAEKGEDYSKVFITSYIFMLVEEVDLEDSIIITDVEEIELGDQRPDGFAYTLTLEDGTEIGLEDLQENDVLNILANPIADGDINNDKIVEMTIVVTRSTVEGTVEEDLDDGKFVINGEEYLNYGAKLAVGDVARFFLTIDNKLYDVDNEWEGEDGASKNYGFVTAVGATTSFGEKTYEIKMYTIDGSLATYQIADKLYVYEDDANGDFVKKGPFEGSAQDTYFGTTGKIKVAVADQASEYKAVQNIKDRFITYKLNSNDEIKEIRFAEGNANNNEFSVATGSGAYNPNTEKFAGKFITSKSVLIYAEPEAEGGVWNFDENAIEILPFDSLDEDADYSKKYIVDGSEVIVGPSLFDVRDNEIGVAFVTAGVDTNKKSALAVVVGTSTVSNDQKKINFFQNGEFLSYVVSEDCDDLDGIGAGDIFQYTLSGDEILRATVVADYKDGNVTLKASSTDVVKYLAGEVDDKEAKYIVVDGSDYSFAKGEDVGTVAIYNTARSGKNAVTALSSLSGLKKSGATYTYKVIIRMEDDEIVDAIEYQYVTAEEEEETATPSAPASDAPASDAPASDAPASDAPASDAPASDAPASDAPASDAPSAPAE